MQFDDIRGIYGWLCMPLEEEDRYGFVHNKRVNN